MEKKKFIVKVLFEIPVAAENQLEAEDVAAEFIENGGLEYLDASILDVEERRLK